MRTFLVPVWFLSFEYVIQKSFLSSHTIHFTSFALKFKYGVQFLTKGMDFSLIILQFFFLLGILPFYYSVTSCGLFINLARDLCFLKDSNPLLVYKIFIYFHNPFCSLLIDFLLDICIFTFWSPLFLTLLKSLSLYLILNNFIRPVSGSENFLFICIWSVVKSLILHRLYILIYRPTRRVCKISNP